MKPVYIINGFLESGKTEFITYTLSQPYFQIRGKTLLIVCEEGEVEYEEVLLRKSRTVMEVIDEEENFTPENLIELEKKYKPERIVIEYNGMWNCKNMKLPWHWSVEQQITTINGATFQNYYTNMKSLLAEQIRKSELIIFNRCDGLNEQLGNFNCFLFMQIIYELCKIKRLVLICLKYRTVISAFHNTVNDSYILAIGNDHISP